MSNEPIVRDFVVIDEKGVKYTDGGQYEDAKGNLFNMGLIDELGTASHNWNNGFIRFKHAGNISLPNNRMLWHIQYSHKFQTGPNVPIHFHVHYAHPSGDTSIYTFRIDYAIIHNGEGFDLDNLIWTTVELQNIPEHRIYDIDGGGQPFVMQVLATPEPNIEKIGVSDIIMVRMTRTDAEGMDDLFVSHVDFHGRVSNMGGSYNEWTK